MSVRDIGGARRDKAVNASTSGSISVISENGTDTPILRLVVAPP
jgi:hypothetical protein